MVRPEEANWLDNAITKTAPGTAPKADFTAWRKAHPEAIDALTRRAQRRTRPRVDSPGVIEFGRRIMRSPITKLAVAAAIILAILGGIHYLGGSIDGTSRAFADVCRNVTQSSTLQFAIRSGSLAGRVYEKDGYLVRAELQWPGPMQFDTILTDKQADNHLYMDSQRKVAWHPSVQTQEAPSHSLYELFTNSPQMPGYSVKKLGKERIDGRVSVGFRLTAPHKELGPLQYDIWTDPETRMPVRIDFTGYTPNGQTIEQTITDIVFDEPLDDALFDFEPEGFQIIDEGDLSTGVGEVSSVSEGRQEPEGSTSKSTAETAPVDTDTVEPSEASAEEPVAGSASATGAAGIVVDKLTQTPIVGAMIGNPRSDSMVETDASGRFLWMGIRPTEHVYVSVIAQDHASKRIVTSVAQGQITKNLRIELDRSSRVAGTVTDPEGRPIPGATVETWQFANRPAITGPDGEFDIDGLSPIAGTYTLRVTHPDYPGASLQFSPGAAGQTVYQDVVLTPGVAIRGRVTGPDGQPLSGAVVTAVTWEARSDETDAQGWYHLENVPLGDLTLRAAHPDHALYVERAMLTDDTNEKQIDIELETGVPLYGRIVDAGGAPVPNAQVAIHEYNDVTYPGPARYTSDAEGRFTILNIPTTGEIVLEPFGSGISGELQKFELGQAEYVLSVAQAGRIYGQVVAEATGEPVTEFTVKMTTSKMGEGVYRYAAMWVREGVTFKSSEGFFDTGEGDLPIGSAYRMTVFAPGYDAMTLDPVPVQPRSEAPQRTVFRLSPGVLVTGLVVDERDHPVEGAMVAVFSDSERNDPAYWRRFETDAAGIFVISGAARDQRYVYITASGRAPYYCLKNDLETEGEIPTKVVLLPGTAVFGTVVDAAGQPMSGARVRLWKEKDPDTTAPDYPFTTINKTTRTDANGDYGLGDLPVGRCRISVVSEAGDTLATRIVELMAGQTRQVDFGKEAGFSIAGIVRRGVTPVADVDVTLRCSDESTRSARTDGAGRFALSGVPGGEAEVEVSWDVAVDATGIRKEDLLNQTVVIDGDADLDLDLGAGLVSGSVPDTLKGQEGLRIGIRRWVERPAPDYRSIVNAWENAHKANRNTTIDADGSFHCSGLRAGRYYLVLSDKTRVRGITDIFELAESQDLRDVTFRTGQGRLNIRILDAPTRRGLAGARFTVMNDLEWAFWDHREATDGRDSRTVTDAQGLAEREDLPAGRYRVTAWAFGHLPTRSEFVTLNGTGVQALTVEMAPAAMAAFEFSESLRRRVDTDSIYVKCRVTDLDSGQSVPSLMSGFVSEEHGVSISLEQPEYALGSVLHLPEGRYRIDYALRPYNTVKHVVEMPFHEGTVTVELTTGQIQTVFLDD